MKAKRKEWSVSEARSQLSDLISQAFDEPQIIIDRKTKDEKAVAVVPLSMLDDLERMRREVRKAQLDAIFMEMQEAAANEGYDGSSEILLPRTPPKPPLDFETED
jgi:prevent-host-death family protein